MMRNKLFWRRIIVYALYVTVCAMLQVTLPETVSIRGQQPDLTLVFAVLTGYLFGLQDGFIIGLSAGLMRDLLAGRVLGLGMLLLMYAGLAAAVLLQRFFKRNVIFGLVQVAFFTVVYEMMIVLITFLIPLQPDITYSFAFLLSRLPQRLPAQVLVNLAAGVPLALLLIFLGPYRRSERGEQARDTFSGDSLWRTG